MEQVIQDSARLISEAVHESGSPGWLEAIRVILLTALAGGAWGIAWVNHRAEKFRRTADLIRVAISDPDLVERTARIFAYRRQEQKLPDPYKDQQTYSYEHDLICTLNFFDTVCIEAKENIVYPKLVRDHLRDIIVGLTALLDELDAMVDYDVRSTYPILTNCIAEWAD